MTIPPHNFLRDFCHLSSGTEIPQPFAFWSGLCTLSFALERKVWIEHGPFTLYPNLLVVLVAASGRMRKSSSVGFITRLLDRVDSKPRMIPPGVTPQALIDYLQPIGNPLVDVDHRPCGGVMIADEITTFLSRSNFDLGLAPYLTQLYDCQNTVEYKSIRSGTVTLRHTFLSLIGATTPDLLRQSFPESAIGSGVTSRIIFISHSTPSPPVSRPRVDSTQHDAFGRCTQYFDNLTLLNGRMELTEPAWAYYSKVYDEFYAHSPLFDDPYLRGYASRRGDHVLKLSMLFALAHRPHLEIEEIHVHQAVETLRVCEREVRGVLELVAGGEDVEMQNLLKGYICRSRVIKRTDLMRMVSHRVNAKRLSELIDTLVTEGTVEVVMDGKGVVYRWVGDAPTFGQ